MAALCRFGIMAAAMLILAGTQTRAAVIGNLATGGSVGLDGLTFTISGCGSSSAGLCNNVMLQVTDSPGYVAAEFLGNGGTYGSNVLAVSDGSLQYLWFNLTVTSRRTLTALSGAVTGTGYNNTQILGASSGCSVSGGWDTGIYCAAYAFKSAATQTSFNGTTSLNISYSLGIQGSAGQTFVLNNATSTFKVVPEPGAAMAIVPGLVALYWLRRRGPRRARRTAPAGSIKVNSGRAATE
jgi:hypothetical protein